MIVEGRHKSQHLISWIMCTVTLDIITPEVYVYRFERFFHLIYCTRLLRAVTTSKRRAITKKRTQNSKHGVGQGSSSSSIFNICEDALNEAGILYPAVSSQNLLLRWLAWCTYSVTYNGSYDVLLFCTSFARSSLFLSLVV